MARGEFDYSANTGKLQVPSATPDLSVTPGSTRTGGVVKDGTLQALDTIGKIGGVATKQYAQYKKTRQAMNFQADVIEGTIGSRVTEDDTFYKSLALGNELQDQHTDFMARAKSDPAYAEMSAEEFQQAYQAEFTESWASITADGPSADELKMTSNVALASQKEATAWHALEHGKVLHAENVRVVGETMHNVFSSGADQDTMLKQLEAIGEGGDVTEHELQSLLVQMSMGFAQDGDDAPLLIAKSLGLHKDPRYADNVRKAQDLYTKEIASRNSMERIAAQTFLKVASGEGTLTVDHVKAYMEKFPEDMTDPQFASLLASSMGNAAKATKHATYVASWLKGGSLAHVEKGERAKVVEEGFAQVASEALAATADQPPEVRAEAMLEAQRELAVVHSELSDGFRQEFRAGATSMQLIDKGKGQTAIQPAFARALDTFTYFVDNGKRTEALEWLGGTGSAAAKNMTYAYRNIVEAGIDPETAIARWQSRGDVAAQPEKQLTSRQLQELATEKLTSTDGAGVGFWSTVGRALGFDTEAATPTNAVETRAMLIGLARDKFEYADVDTWEDAMDLALKDMPDGLTSVGTQVVLGSKSQILERMGAKDLIGDRPTHPNRLLDEYKELNSGEILEALKASSKEGALQDMDFSTERGPIMRGMPAKQTISLSNVRPVVHSKGSRISFVLDHNGERLETPSIPMSEIGKSVGSQRKIDDELDKNKTREERKALASQNIDTMIVDVTATPDGLWNYGLSYEDVMTIKPEDLLTKVAMAKQLRIIKDSAPMVWGDSALDTKALMRLRYRGHMQDGMDEFIDNYYAKDKTQLSPQQQHMVSVKLDGLKAAILMKD